MRHETRQTIKHLTSDHNNDHEKNYSKNYHHLFKEKAQLLVRNVLGFG